MSSSKFKKNKVSCPKKSGGMCLTGKVCFSSKLAADISIMHRNSRNRQETLFRSYKCRYCDFYPQASKVKCSGGWENKR